MVWFRSQKGKSDRAMNKHEITQKVLRKYYLDESKFDLEDFETERDKIIKLTIQLCQAEFEKEKKLMKNKNRYKERP